MQCLNFGLTVWTFLPSTSRVQMNSSTVPGNRFPGSTGVVRSVMGGLTRWLFQWMKEPRIRSKCRSKSKIGSFHASRTVGYPECEIWTGNSENLLRTVRFTIASWIGFKSAHFYKVELAKSGGPNFESLVLRAETIFFTKFFFKHYLHDEPCPTS